MKWREKRDEPKKKKIMRKEIGKKKGDKN